MATILFYEKPGCKNNTKQKRLLQTAGHQLEIKNLLTEAWTVEKLRPFFGSLPVVEWFNKTAPQIQSGEINPVELEEDTALQLMISDPLLIRRPLMKVGTDYRVGFEQEQVNHWIGLDVNSSPSQDLETCPKTHQQQPCSSPQK
jgi:nitrogenase-associated protein